MDVKGSMGWAVTYCSMRALLQIYTRIYVQQKNHRRIWGKIQLFVKFRIPQHRKWHRNQELPSKGSLGAATGNFHLEKAPARNKQLRVPFAWSISGQKKNKPKDFLGIVTELGITYIDC